MVFILYISCINQYITYYITSVWKSRTKWQNFNKIKQYHYNQSESNIQRFRKEKYLRMIDGWLTQRVTTNYNEWQRMRTSDATNNNEPQRVTMSANEWQRVTTSGRKWYNEDCEWKGVVQRVTTNDSAREQVKVNDFRFQYETEGQNDSWRFLFNFLWNVYSSNLEYF